jgi:hypothetical protein
MSRLEFTAIDPGERWMGYAQLTVSGGLYRASSAVFDLRDRAFVERVNLVRRELPTRLIVEDYRQRPVGYNRFSDGGTLRLLGALQYIAECDGLTTFALVPPGDPDKELQHLPISLYLESWRRRWPNPNTTQWQHCRAAWRVLSRHLLAKHVELMTALVKNARALRSLTIEAHLAYRPEHGDLIAPDAWWKLPTANGSTPTLDALA